MLRETPNVKPHSAWSCHSYSAPCSKFNRCRGSLPRSGSEAGSQPTPSNSPLTHLISSILPTIDHHQHLTHKISLTTTTFIVYTHHSTLVCVLILFFFWNCCHIFSPFLRPPLSFQFVRLYFACCAHDSYPCIVNVPDAPYRNKKPFTISISGVHLDLLMRM